MPPTKYIWSIASPPRLYTLQNNRLASETQSIHEVLNSYIDYNKRENTMLTDLNLKFTIKYGQIDLSPELTIWTDFLTVVL